MTTLLISRHPSAIAWVKSKMPVDEVLTHLTDEDLAKLTPAHTVIGTLPIHLAAAVCEKGATFIYLSLDTPPELRGQELTVEQMDQLGARLERYHVEKQLNEQQLAMKRIKEMRGKVIVGDIMKPFDEVWTADENNL
jgi:CRISPR-associated protein Csx16